MPENLIIYFSHKGENYVNGSIRPLSKGNTEICAEFLQKALDGDLFEIEPLKEYSSDYMVCVEEAKADLKAGTRPELKKYLEDISSYENIFICGPCWCGTYPAAVFTQLEKLDFTGKKVFPLVTHEGSGLAGIPAALKKCCKGARIGKGLAVKGGAVSRSEKEIISWARTQTKR